MEPRRVDAPPSGATPGGAQGCGARGQVWRSNQAADSSSATKREQGVRHACTLHHGVRRQPYGSWSQLPDRPVYAVDAGVCGGDREMSAVSTSARVATRREADELPRNLAATARTRCRPKRVSRSPGRASSYLFGDLGIVLLWPTGVPANSRHPPGRQSIARHSCAGRPALDQPSLERGDGLFAHVAALVRDRGAHRVALVLEGQRMLELARGRFDRVRVGGRRKRVLGRVKRRIRASRRP
jgi:hypothetical protein